MWKFIKLVLILFAINFAIFAIGDAMHVNDFVLYLFILPVSITVSLILVIISVIKNIRNSYIAKDAAQRKASRKKMLITFAGFTAFLLIAGIVLMFACGFKIPGRDRHKNWPYFPGSSNPEMILKAIPNLYIYHIQPMPDTPYYLVHFTRDSVSYKDSYASAFKNFGIIDSKGNFKIEYQRGTTEFIDGNRIIVRENTYGDEKLPAKCDVINIQTLDTSQVAINRIPIPATKEEFDKAYNSEQGQALFKEKYRTDFFRNLRGVKQIESERNYSSGDYMGYTLYSNADGKLYETNSYDDISQLDVLSPQVAGYTTQKQNAFKNKATNIKPSGEPIVLYNEVSGGLTNDFSPYYKYYQTWLLYYTAFIGKNSTSFKLEGGDKNSPYTDFYQLNRVSNERDTLVFVADGKLWTIHKK